MAKAASITLVGLERTNGSGWTVIKITGDVASVQSAIITGASFADQQQGLIAHKVIARPGEGILSRATVIPPAPMPAPEPETEPESEPDVVVVEESVPEAEPEAGMVSCNLCLDPACKRQKGEPRSLCLHSGK
ncbi:BMC domain protein [Citrobacter koseri]|nr:BMC domain protein [Citrobacter koseri]KWZ99451.1 BMC domain protein [Citrobacter koseri]KXB41172.1 BMC domain protein [Citrobacter koseri]